MSGHIVVNIDPAEDNAIAVRKGFQLAQASHSELTLFAGVFEPALAGDNLHQHSARDAHLAKMADSLTRLQALADQPDKVSTRIDLEWSQDPTHRLLEKLEETPATLVVKATHHQSVIQRTFFSHTDWDLIRHCPAPLLLTKSKAWSDTPNLAAAVDPVREPEADDGLNGRVVNLAHQWANYLSAEVHLIHAYDPTPLMIYLDQPAINAAEFSDQIRDQHASALHDLAHAVHIPKKNIHLEIGPPAQRLPEFVTEQDIDVIAMGTAQRSGFERWLLGHTAEKVLDRVTADVLIAR